MAQPTSVSRVGGVRMRSLQRTWEPALVSLVSITVLPGGETKWQLISLFQFDFIIPLEYAKNRSGNKVSKNIVQKSKFVP